MKPAVTTSEMRSAVLAALVSGQQPRDFESFKGVVAWQLQARGLRALPGHGDNQYQLDRGDWVAYRDVIWELIVGGVLGPGWNASNEALPFLGMTEFGQRMLDEEQPSPLDTEPFVSSLEAVMALDDVERRFVPQALLAFRRQLWDASAVMIGAAGEHLVETLAVAIAQHDAAFERKLTALARAPASKWFEAVNAFVVSRERDLPHSLREKRELAFTGIGLAIRITRNDAGHPSAGGPADRETAYTALEFYRTYRRWVAELLLNLPSLSGGAT